MPNELMPPESFWNAIELLVVMAAVLCGVCAVYVGVKVLKEL